MAETEMGHGVIVNVWRQPLMQVRTMPCVYGWTTRPSTTSVMGYMVSALASVFNCSYYYVNNSNIKLYTININLLFLLAFFAKVNSATIRTHWYRRILSKLSAEMGLSILSGETYNKAESNVQIFLAPSSCCIVSQIF